MTEMIKKILRKTLLLMGILVAMNFIYQYFFEEKDIQAHSEVINRVRNLPEDAEVVYVGESSNITNRSDDKDKRPISGFLADYYPGLAVHDITKTAAHAGIYYTLLANIPEENNIETLVVTLNLRSFNAQWIYSDLETPLQKSMVLLQDWPPLLNRTLLSFKAYDIKTPKEREAQFKRKWKKDRFDVPFRLPYRDVIAWDSYIGRNGILNEEGKRDQPKTELACHYVKGYAFQIDFKHNPRIRDFDKIVKLSEKRGWKLVFNLLAENVEMAQILVGNNLTWFMRDNAKRLVDYYSAKGVIVVNNLEAVEDEQFIDRNWTTEHYAEKGRRTIARNVALALQNIYPDQYTEQALPKEQ